MRSRTSTGTIQPVIAPDPCITIGIIGDFFEGHMAVLVLIELQVVGHHLLDLAGAQPLEGADQDVVYAVAVRVRNVSEERPRTPWMHLQCQISTRIRVLP